MGQVKSFDNTNNSTSSSASNGNNSTNPIAATYPQHWKQGAIFSATHLAFWASEVQTTITVPENYPYSGDYTFIGLSVWGTGTSYDQVGIYDQPSGWEILTGWTSGCASQTYYDYGVQPYPGGYLFPNTQYTFWLQSFGNGTIKEAASLGTTTSFPIWVAWYNTGDNYFQMGSTYGCWVGSNQYSYDDYTLYEEVGVTGSYKGTTGEDVPNWDYTFDANSWVVQTGCGCGTWSSYQVGGGPSYTSSTVNTYNGNTITNNQDGNVTIGTTLGSGTLAYLTAVPGSHLYVNGNTYLTCCSGGGTATLSILGLPTGWTATFTPSSGTPSFSYVLDLWIPTSGPLAGHWLQVNTSWGSGLWTTALFYVYVGSGHHGGGGCIGWGTSILTPTGLVPIQYLVPGAYVDSYVVSTGTEINEQVLWNNFSWSTSTVSINGGALLVTSTNQPLYVKNGSWIGIVNDPRNLTVGEYLYNPSTSSWILITSLGTLTALTPVYDLQVGGPQDFKAGGDLTFVKYHGGGV